MAYFTKIKFKQLDNVLDEDNMASNSDTSLATQQSIKAYVDSQVSGSSTLNLTGESGSGSVNLTNSTLDFAAGEGIDITISSNQVTIAGEDASDSNKGIASFDNGDFSVSSGAVTLVDTVVKTITSDSGPLTPSSHSLSILGGEGMDVTHIGTTITVAGEDASDSNKGIASFDASDFGVSSGAVSLADSVVKTITSDSGALTPSAHGLSILGGEGMDVTHSGTTITVAGEDASDSNKGIASFDSGDFSVSSGAVTLADSASGAVIAIAGTANEVDVSRSNGTVTVGLPSDVTIANDLTVNGDLIVNGTTTTVNSTTVQIDDLNLQLADGSALIAAVDGGGITVAYNGGSLTWQYNHASTAWKSNIDADLAATKVYKIDGTEVLSASGAAKVQAAVAGAGLTETSGVLDVVNATNGGLSVGANSVSLDLNDLATATVDVSADSIAIYDDSASGTKKQSIAGLMTAVAGTGLAESAGVLELDLSELSAATVDTSADSIAIITSGGDSRQESISDLVGKFVENGNGGIFTNNGSMSVAEIREVFGGAEDDGNGGRQQANITSQADYTISIGDGTPGNDISSYIFSLNANAIDAVMQGAGVGESKPIQVYLNGIKQQHGISTHSGYSTSGAFNVNGTADGVIHEDYRTSLLDCFVFYDSDNNVLSVAFPVADIANGDVIEVIAARG